MSEKGIGVGSHFQDSETLSGFRIQIHLSLGPKTMLFPCCSEYPKEDREFFLLSPQGELLPEILFKHRNYIFFVVVDLQCCARFCCSANDPVPPVPTGPCSHLPHVLLLGTGCAPRAVRQDLLALRSKWTSWHLPTPNPRPPLPAPSATASLFSTSVSTPVFPLCL